MKVVLMGYMGSGKSAVAGILSSKLGLKWIDLDHYIEAKEGLSVADLFAKKGEIYFRRKERVCLEEILAAKTPCLLSLGGGTPCFSGNLELVQQKAISLYLKTAVEVLHGRLQAEKSKRPLIADLPTNRLKDFIAKHLFERAAFYEKATHTIVTNHKTPEEVAAEMAGLLKKPS